jgi:hypothetical protein
MSKRILFASIASMCVLANCTPYQEIDRDEGPGDVSSPAAADPATETPATGPDASPAEGGAGQIDQAVATATKVTRRADIEPAVDAMMTLADKDTNGQLDREEYGILAPALGQADETVPTNAGTTVGATPGTSERAEETGQAPITQDEFFAETAGADGTISRDDLTSALTARFETADADSDGTLTAEEAATFSSSMRFARN